MKPTLLILAAGLGNRYGGLKQIDQIGPSGETLMDYSIYDAIRVGFSKIIFIIKHSIEVDFKELIRKKYQGKIEIDFVFQEIDKVPETIKISTERSKPWGTAHAVLMAAEKIDSPFVVINADDFYGYNSYKSMFDFFEKSNNPNEFSMIGFPITKTLSNNGGVSRGICQLNIENYLLEIIEKTKIEKIDEHHIANFENNKWVEIKENALVSMNIWGFTPAIFPILEKSFSEFISANKNNLSAELLLPNVIDSAIKLNQVKVKVLECNSEWFGITYKEDKSLVNNRLQALIKAGEYPNNLFENSFSS